jgi:hypothetical protein
MLIELMVKLGDGVKQPGKLAIISLARNDAKAMERTHSNGKWPRNGSGW